MKRKKKETAVFGVVHEKCCCTRHWIASAMKEGKTRTFGEQHARDGDGKEKKEQEACVTLTV